jgi:hypothetical protein
LTGTKNNNVDCEKVMKFIYGEDGNSLIALDTIRKDEQKQRIKKQEGLSVILYATKKTDSATDKMDYHTKEYENTGTVNFKTRVDSVI